MIININQIIDAIVNHIPVLFIAAGIVFLFLAFFDVDIKPPTVKVTDKLTQIRKIIIGMGILLMLVGLPLQLLSTIPVSGQRPQPTRTVISQVTPTGSAVNTPIVHITDTSVSTPQNPSDSSLIPPGQQPVIDDPLKDNSEGYEWDIQSDSNGSCSFAQGRYLLSAPAGINNGVGCQAESPKGTFSNFVYQVQMTILTGVDNDQSGAGPTFRTNTSGTGQQYQVLFDVEGDWQVSTDANPLAGGACANPCPYFHAGFNQSNYITIRASGNFIQIQINGYNLGSYTDNTYSSGAIGVQMNPGTDNGSVAFSNVRVWQL